MNKQSVLHYTLGMAFVLSFFCSFYLPGCLFSAAAGALSPSASYLGTHVSERIGYSLAGQGDANGDGYSDFIIGTMHTNGINGEKDAGGVYLILSNPSRLIMDQHLNLTADAIFRGKNTFDRVGYGISMKGDVNGDGCDDLLLGAPAGDPDMFNPGRVFLTFGRRNADWGKNFILNQDADVTFTGEKARDGAGISVDIIGDLNSDGFDEFIIGSPFNPQTDCRGKAYFFRGKQTWDRNIKLSDADACFIGTVTNGNAGYSVAGVGDVNGDGIPDFAIGQPEKYSGTWPPVGKVFLIFGRANMNWGKSFDLNNADIVFTGETNDRATWTGWKVAAAGDVNKDGRGDIIITAPAYDYCKGKIYVVFGKISGWSNPYPLSNADATFIGENYYYFTGWSAQGMGDINRDGYADFLIGSNTIDYNPNVNGKAYLIKGQKTGWGQNVNLGGIPDFYTGEYPANGVGYDVSIVGDFNRDWVDDLIVSAPWFHAENPNGGDEGKIYFFKGEKWFKAVLGSVMHITHVPVRNVSVRVNSDSITSTDGQAKYLLTFNPGYTGTVTLFHPRSPDSLITSYDAALVAKHIAGISSLSAGLLKAADANADGYILMNDAVEIARYAVGMKRIGTRICDWVFDPPSRTYANIQSDQEGQNYSATIRGDLDNSWGNSLPKPSGRFGGLLGKNAIWRGDTLEAVFSLDGSVSIISFDLMIDIDSLHLSYCGYKTGSGYANFIVFDCMQSGTLKVGGFCTGGSAGPGPMITLKFHAAHGGTASNTLRLKKAQLDGDVVERDVNLSLPKENQPGRLMLLRSYPNPFNSRTVVEYVMQQSGRLGLWVFDARGRRIKALVDMERPAGLFRMAWDGTDERGEGVPSGIYVVRAEDGIRNQHIKLLLMK